MSETICFEAFGVTFDSVLVCCRQKNRFEKLADRTRLLTVRWSDINLGFPISGEGSLPSRSEHQSLKSGRVAANLGPLLVF
jgi:hypothetical protein